MVGQVPIYLGQKNTGKPPSPETVVLIDDIDADADQLSTGLTAYHLDAGYEPLFPFGHGLSYAIFIYEHLRLDRDAIRIGESLTVSVDVVNAGDRDAVEVAQLYVRDLVGSVTRPVRELKGFERLSLTAGERRTIDFELSSDDLAFYGRDNRLAAEPGEFEVYVGGSSATRLMARFRIVAND